MAATSRNHQVLKHTIRLFSSPRKVEGLGGAAAAAQPEDEFDESEVWCCHSESKPDNPIRPIAPRSRSTWKKVDTRVGCGSGSGSGSGSSSGSVPVNIPDWSKILLHEHKTGRSCYNGSGFGEEEEEEEEGGGIVPPHEVVMRRRAASLSVVEGAGRTLKGRDLSRVRNAIWAQTGFQD